jgi:hypothetical protein
MTSKDSRDGELMMRYEVDNGRLVTESALIERINEKLSEDSQDRREMQMTGSPSIGNFYEHQNEIINRDGDIDLDAIGRELGVLAPDETIAHCTRLPSGSNDAA